MSMIQLLAAGKSFRDGGAARNGVRGQVVSKREDAKRADVGATQPELFTAVAPEEKRDSARRSLFRMPGAGMARSTRAMRTAEQAELALESVKVVRNDLSESDLELASVKAEPAPQRYVIPAAPKPGIWQRFTGWLEARV